MSEIDIRVTGRAGRITLRRPKALNAVTHDMVRAISAALPRFAADARVKVVVIDAEGERAFSAGGDIASIYADLTAGRFDRARQFWRDEYPMNAAIARFPKPVVSLMQGFTMGGGVGVGCHASCRVVGETSRIAMPECGIGLVPDVGGSMLLARAPGRMGEYLGLTGARMGPGDAILAGFADVFVPEAAWPGVIAALEAEGDVALVEAARADPPEARIEVSRLDAYFGQKKMGDIVGRLRAAGDDWAQETLRTLSQKAPLSMACALELIRAARTGGGIDAALRREYRFVHRIVEQGDFAEGIRAAIIDRDTPARWAHDAPDGAGEAEVAAMLAPLGPQELELGETA